MKIISQILSKEKIINFTNYKYFQVNQPIENDTAPFLLQKWKSKNNPIHNKRSSKSYQQMQILTTKHGNILLNQTI